MYSKGFNTRAAQPYFDEEKIIRPLSPPIVQATTFAATSSQEHGELFRSGDDRFYQRFGNPTVSHLGKKVAALEGGEAALVFPSGMSAISTSLFTVLKSGDHVVAQRDLFAQTYSLLGDTARNLGIETTFVDATKPGVVSDALRENTALIYIETPSNPLLKIIDIEAICAIGRQRRLPVFVDNTFASPFLQRPLEFGATLVLHSGTKYFGGHSDVMSGFAVGSRDLIDAIRQGQILLGGVLDPHAAWLVLRSIQTLGLRIARQSCSALRLAEYLESQPGVSAVHYPWLESSPFYTLARKQMGGGGGVVSFELSGGLKAARTFLNALRLIPTATSLGGVETIVEIPSELDFNSTIIGAEHQAEAEIRPGLVRLSVGIEDIDDLLLDLARGIESLGS